MFRTGQFFRARFALPAGMLMTGFGTYRATSASPVRRPCFVRTICLSRARFHRDSEGHGNVQSEQGPCIEETCAALVVSVFVCVVCVGTCERASVRLPVCFCSAVALAERRSGLLVGA
eukprot:14912272-Alexandrium_andersonii.AAC.1